MSQHFDWRNLVNIVADHEARATRHRPTEHEQLLRDVMRLRAQGLMPRDIAVALGLNDHDVTTMLYGPDEPGAA